MHVLVAGAGWLGGAIVRALVERGERVTAVRRSAERVAPLARAGAATLALDLSQPGAGGRIPRDVDAIVACQSSNVDSVPAYTAAYLDANRTLLEVAERNGARSFVYTGSTGVFGQRDGSDVYESTAPAPASATAEVLVRAEELVLEAASRGVRASLVRLSGLYGPGRHGILERVRGGALALGPGDQAWMNFCHLDDAVAFVVAALDRGHAGAAYHGTDAHPARRAEVVQWVAERLGVAPSTTAHPPAGPDRRIHSEWTRERLAVTLRWPSFREGLGATPIVPSG